MDFCRIIDFSRTVRKKKRAGAEEVRGKNGCERIKSYSFLFRVLFPRLMMESESLQKIERVYDTLSSIPIAKQDRASNESEVSPEWKKCKAIMFAVSVLDAKKADIWTTEAYVVLTLLCDSSYRRDGTNTWPRIQRLAENCQLALDIATSFVANSNDYLNHYQSEFWVKVTLYSVQVLSHMWDKIEQNPTDWVMLRVKNLLSSYQKRTVKALSKKAQIAFGQLPHVAHQTKTNNSDLDDNLLLLLPHTSHCCQLLYQNMQYFVQHSRLDNERVYSLAQNEDFQKALPPPMTVDNVPHLLLPPPDNVPHLLLLSWQDALTRYCHQQSDQLLLGFLGTRLKKLAVHKFLKQTKKYAPQAVDGNYCRDVVIDKKWLTSKKISRLFRHSLDTKTLVDSMLAKDSVVSVDLKAEIKEFVDL
jgi:hypothetical protein